MNLITAMNAWFHKIVYSNNWAQSDPVVIQIVIIYLLLIVLSLLIIYTILFNTKFFEHIYNIQKRRWTPIVQTKLIEIISSVQDNNVPPSDQLTQYINDPNTLKLIKGRSRRRILIDNIIDIREQVSGNTRTFLRDIYIELELYKDALKNLRSIFPNRTIRAINELNKMEYVLEDKVVQKLASRKNAYIQHVAQTYYFTTYSDFSLDILRHRKKKLTTLDEIELFSIISKCDPGAAPQFSKWIKTGVREDIIALAAKLAVEFGQFEAYKNMVTLLDKSSNWLKEKLINAIGKLMQPESEDLLTELYEKESNLQVRKAILKALGRVSANHSADFLVQAFLKENDFTLKNQAAISAFQSISFDDIKEKPFFQQISSQEKEIILHVKNPLIKTE